MTNVRRSSLALGIAAAVSVRAASAGPPPIVVQGAMPIETDALARRLEHVRVEKVFGWTFWRGTLGGYPVVVSKTRKGVASAAAATALAVERFRPVAILDQGTAGGHDPSLHVYDIVLGTSAVSLGAFKSPVRQAGAGSDPLQWTPLALTVSEGSAGNDPRARTVARFAADEALLAAARSVSPSYERGRVVLGVDRVERHLEQRAGPDCELPVALRDFGRGDGDGAGRADRRPHARPVPGHPHRVEQHHERRHLRREDGRSVPGIRRRSREGVCPHAQALKARQPWSTWRARDRNGHWQAARKPLVFFTVFGTRDADISVAQGPLQEIGRSRFLLFQQSLRPTPRSALSPT